MLARAQAEKDLRTGDPEFASMARAIEHQIFAYLQGSASADLLQARLRETLVRLDQARLLVDKTIGQGDFDREGLECRRKYLLDLDTMVHGKLEWLAQHANRGLVRETGIAERHRALRVLG